MSNTALVTRALARPTHTTRLAAALLAGAALLPVPAFAGAQLVVAASAGGPCGQDVQKLEFPDLSVAQVSAAVSCPNQGTFGSARARADAGTASLGVEYTAQTPSPYNGGAGASAALGDDWFITLPPGTTDPFLTIPVTMTIEGSVAESAPTIPGQPVLYDFQIADNLSFDAGSAARFEGALDNSFNGLLQLSGAFRVRNLVGATTPVSVRVNLYLSAGGSNGNTDLFNTAWLSLDLPQGSSVTNASGLPITFLSTGPGLPPVTAVPEPASYALFAAGLAALGAMAARRRARATNAT